MKVGILILCLSLASCTTASVPRSLLVCPDEPRPGDIRIRSEFLDYVESLRQAGDACRIQLRTAERILYGSNQNN